MMDRSRLLAAVALSAVLLLTPSIATAAISGRIVENVGIKTAKLGLHDSTDTHRLGWSYRRVVNRDYQGAGYVVYEYYFGKKGAKSHKYPLEMYSAGNHHVFTFVINTSSLKTKNGTGVGTSESALTSRYGATLKSSSGSIYTDYYLGTRAGRTDFYVRAGKVHHIVVSRY